MIIILMLIALFNITHLISSESTSVPVGFIDNGISIFLETGEYYQSNAPLLTDDQLFADAVFSTFLTHIGEGRYPIITTSQMYYLLISARMFAEVARGEKDIAVLKDLQINTNNYYSKTFDINQYKNPEKTLIPLLQEMFNLNQYLKHIESVLLKKTSIFTLIWERLKNPFLSMHAISPSIFLPIAAYFNFMPQNWIIKDLGADMILMIPRTFSDAFPESRLDINNLKDLTIPQAQQSLQKQINGDNVIQAIPKAFIEKNIYREKKQTAPRWGIFINAHGAPHGRIAIIGTQLPLLLMQLNSTIQLNLVAIQTCFAGGTLAENITKSMYNKLNDKLSYYPAIIALGSITSNATLISRTQYPHPFYFSRNGDQAENIKIRITNLEITNFFDELRSREVIDFENTLNYVFAFKFNDEYISSNIPIIKFPHAEGFQVINARNFIVSLGKNLIQARDPKKLLNLRTFQGAKYFGAEEKGKKKQEQIDPKLILLYDNYIPFPLAFNKRQRTDTFPEFIYMPHQKKEIIIIDELHAYDFDLLEVMRKFSTTLTATPTIFYIKKLVLNKSQRIPSKNVIILSNIRHEKILDALSEKTPIGTLNAVLFKDNTPKALWNYQTFNSSEMQIPTSSFSLANTSLDTEILTIFKNIGFAVPEIGPARPKPYATVESNLMLQQLKQTFFNFNEDITLIGQALQNKSAF